jgi:hypothetical protein
VLLEKTVVLGIEKYLLWNFHVVADAASVRQQTCGMADAEAVANLELLRPPRKRSNSEQIPAERSERQP